MAVCCHLERGILYNDGEESFEDFLRRTGMENSLDYPPPSEIASPVDSQQYILWIWMPVNAEMTLWTVNLELLNLTILQQK